MEIIQETSKKFNIVLKCAIDIEDVIAHYVITESEVITLADYRFWINWTGDLENRMNKSSIIIAINCDGGISDKQYKLLSSLLANLWNSTYVYVDPIVFPVDYIMGDKKLGGILFESSFTNGDEFEYFEPEKLNLEVIR